MSYLIQCAVDASPCPPESQVGIADINLQTLAEIGLTPSGITSAIAFGFAVVVGFAVLGLVVGFVLRLIRSI